MLDCQEKTNDTFQILEEKRSKEYHHKHVTSIPFK